MFLFSTILYRTWLHSCRKNEETSMIMALILELKGSGNCEGWGRLGRGENRVQTSISSHSSSQHRMHYSPLLLVVCNSADTRGFQETRGMVRAAQCTACNFKAPMMNHKVRHTKKTTFVVPFSSRQQTNHEKPLFYMTRLYTWWGCVGVCCCILRA